MDRSTKMTSTNSPQPDLVQKSAVPLRSGSGGQVVEVDSATDIDDDSSGYSSATTSVASSVFSFTYANGRRYHSDRFKSDYFLPNDEAEQDRLDLYHHIFLLILGGKLHIAPLDNPQRVLDVGTGTGIWAIDFADENPQAEVIGTDLSPIQPTWTPPNCRFEIDDMESTWTYPHDYFDYIHIRCMSGAFQNWTKVFEEAYAATKPGGILEFQDYSIQPFLSDGTKLVGVIEEHPISSYAYYLNQAFEKNGLVLDFPPRAEKFIIEAGFEDIVVQTAIWPVGRWPKDKRLKEIGAFARLGSEQGLVPFGLSVLTKQGWTAEKVIEICDKIKETYARGDVKSHNPSLIGKYYVQAWFIYGRKPLNNEKPKA